MPLNISGRLVALLSQDPLGPQFAARTRLCRVFDSQEVEIALAALEVLESQPAESQVDARFPSGAFFCLFWWSHLEESTKITDNRHNQPINAKLFPGQVRKL